MKKLLLVFGTLAFAGSVFAFTVTQTAMYTSQKALNNCSTAAVLNLHLYSLNPWFKKIGSTIDDTEKTNVWIQDGSHTHKGAGHLLVGIPGVHVNEAGLHVNKVDSVKLETMVSYNPRNQKCRIQGTAEVSNKNGEMTDTGNYAAQVNADD